VILRKFGNGVYHIFGVEKNDIEKEEIIIKATFAHSKRPFYPAQPVCEFQSHRVRKEKGLPVAVGG
jgi:hypothetical protein